MPGTLNLPCSSHAALPPPPVYHPRKPAPLIMEGRYPAFPLPTPQRIKSEGVAVEYPEVRPRSRHASTPPSSPGSFISAMTDSEVGGGWMEEFGYLDDAVDRVGDGYGYGYGVEDEDEDWPPRGRARTRETRWFTPFEIPVGREEEEERRLLARAPSEVRTARQRWRFGFAHPHLERVRVPWTGRGWGSPWPAFLVEAYVQGVWYRAGAVPRFWDEVTMLMVPPARADLMWFFWWERERDMEVYRKWGMLS
ncbi:hypothetical protein Q9189_005719 [Teloschistes chrysophthalmus]